MDQLLKRKGLELNAMLPLDVLAFNISCVYVLTQNNKILYIGSAKCLRKRLGTHSVYLRDSHTVYYHKEVDNRFKLETLLIKECKPLLNGKVGRKSIIKTEKQVPVTFYVKEKNKSKAVTEAAVISNKYR